MAKHGGFSTATTMGLFLSCAVVGLLSAGPAPAGEFVAVRVEPLIPGPNGPGVPFAKDDPGGLNWVSRDATYEVSSTHPGGSGSPLPSLLTGQGPLHSVGGARECFAFHTSLEKDPHIIIALAGAPRIQRLFIENRRDEQLERARGLTVWVSGDKKSWQRVWTAKSFAPSWMVTLKAPTKAAYVKIGVTGTNYLHLTRVKIYGGTGGIPSVTRLDRTDRIELNNGDLMLGTINNKSYTVTTFYGKIEVPAHRVIGVVPGGEEPGRVRLVQTDGQVIAGRLTDQSVQLILSVGATLNVPPASIRQFSYRISKDKPARFTASEPMVLLRSGDRLIWTECRTKLQLTGPWGTADLPAQSLQRIERTDTEGRSHRARFPGGTVLAGTLGAKTLTLKLKVVPELEIALKDVRLIVLPTKALTPFEPAATVLLQDGSRVLGRLEGETLALRTEFGQVKVYAGDLKTLTCDAKRVGHVTITTWGGTKLGGQLAAPRLTCRIAPNGPRVSLITTRVASITQPFPLLRPAAQAKAEKLIAQLASESYKDREAATKELVKMGKGVVPLLKKHANSPDAEVHQRIEDILKQTDPKKGEPVPRPDVRMLNGRIILHTRLSQQRIGDARLVVKGRAAAKNTNAPPPNMAGEKDSAKARATQQGNASPTAAEPTVEATGAKPNDQTPAARPASDPTLDGKEILKKLKAIDAVYAAAFTASGKRLGGPVRKWKFTMRRRRIALEEEVVEITKADVAKRIPRGRPGVREGNPMLALRSTFFVGPTAQARYDWVGILKRYGPQAPWPENSPGPATAGSLDVVDPDAPTYMLQIKQTLWCLGRGYSKHITKIRDVSRQKDGRLTVAAAGLDMALRPGAKWELVIDPDAEYMVRSATLVDSRNRRSSFTNSGLKRHGTHCVPAKGECKGALISTSFEFQFASFEADVEFLRRAKATMQPPYLIHTDVYDQRRTPEVYMPYEAGKMSPKGRKPDFDLDWEKEAVFDMAKTVPASEPKLRDVIRGTVTPAFARKGEIKIRGCQYTALLVPVGTSAVSFDRPETILLLTAADNPRHRIQSYEKHLGSIRTVDGKYYKISATPTGDKLTVTPCGDNVGVLQIGAGGRDVERREVTGGVLISKQGVVPLGNTYYPVPAEDRAHRRIPVGDYAPSILYVNFGNVQLSLRPYGPLAFNIKIRKDKPLTINLSAKGNLRLRSPRAMQKFKPGSTVKFVAVIVDPELNLQVCPRVGKVSLAPTVVITDSSGKRVAEGKMPFC